MAAAPNTPAHASRDAAVSQQAEECRVSVAVRIRPSILSIYPGSKASLTVDSDLPQVSTGGQSFTYDHVFGGEHGADPSQLYSKCVAPLVDGLFKGYNATVFAYGQTGSGKTYTMGTDYKPGMTATRAVIPETINAIYEKIAAAKDWQCSVHVSFVEIYQEEMRDLLATTQDNKKALSIREVRNGGVSLRGAIERNVKTQDEMAAVLEMGTASRSTASTNMNQRSSRSHAIFTITLEQWRQAPAATPATNTTTNVSAPATPNTSGGQSFLRSSWDFDKDDVCDAMSNSDAKSDIIYDDYLCAKMHLVDLAGSESVKMTKAEGSRLKESTYINKGLLVLGKVINAIADGHKHIPYRESKLTRLLQDALGGNSRTVMIACVSPAEVNAKETLNTLKYACRARNIRNKPTINRDPVAAQVVSLRCQLADLQRENTILKALTSHNPLAVDPEAQSVACNELAELQFEYKVSQTRIAYLEEQKAAEAEQAAAQQQALQVQLQDMRAAMEKMAQEHEEKVNHLETQLAQVREDSSKQVADLQAQLATAQAEQIQTVETMTADRDAAVTALTQQHGEQVAELKRQHEATIKELQQAMIQQLQVGHAKELSGLNAQHASAIQAMKEQVRDEVLQELQQQLQEAIKAQDQQQRLKAPGVNAFQARMAVEQATRQSSDLKDKFRDDVSDVYAASEPGETPTARAMRLSRPKLPRQIDTYAARLSSKGQPVVDLKVNLELNLKAKNAADLAMRYLNSQRCLTRSQSTRA